LIGDEWFGINNANGTRRLDDPRDYVRLEVETALAKNITVIPVVLQGAPIPAGNELPESLKDLSRRNAIRLSDEHWNSDLNLLTALLNNVLGTPGSLREQRVKRYRQIVFGLSLLGSLLSVANNFIFPGGSAMGAGVRFLYLVILAANSVFVTNLLVSMKQQLDRLGGFIISMAVIAQMFVAWGAPLAPLTPIPLLIVAWLVNFVKPDEEFR
jgi:hypothetical protein